MNRIQPDFKTSVGVDMKRDTARQPQRRKAVVESIASYARNKAISSQQIHTEYDTNTTDNFWESCHFLTNSMALFGQYFKINNSEADPAMSERHRNRCFRYYSFFMVIIHWMNFVRCLTIFTNEKQFGPSLFGHLGYVVWYGLTTFNITCLHLACRSGKLFKTMADVYISEKRESSVMKRTVIISLVAWFVTLFYSCSDFYSYFLSVDYFDSYLLAPVSTLISAEGANLMAMKVVSFAIGVYANANFVFPFAFDFLLTTVIAGEFNRFNRQFKKHVLSNRRQTVTLECFETVNHEYRKLAQAVKKVDSILGVFNGLSIVCLVTFVIVLLYNVIWFQEVINTAYLIVTGICSLATALAALLMVALGSVSVNQSVSSLYMDL